MNVFTTIRELREHLNARRQERTASGGQTTIGFFPTLGYMHEGHASLIRRAREECDVVVISIFVNPLQFGPNEDFDRYPRDMERDLAIAEKAGVDVAFVPSLAEMYPTPIRTTVTVSEVTASLCGASRPGHFDGVATVVSKLLNIVQPNKAYFGMKDAQQVAVIQQMVNDLNINVDIVPCPTLREPDGLAMSSRNVYLSPEERQQAVVLSESLVLAKQLWLNRERITTSQLLEAVINRLKLAPLAVIDYAELVTFPDLQPVDPSLDRADIDQTLLVALAVKFGKTRLIDNCLLQRS